MVSRNTKKSWKFYGEWEKKIRAIVQDELKDYPCPYLDRLEKLEDASKREKPDH